MVVLLAYTQPNTIASNVNSMCNDLYAIIVFLCHSFPGMISCTYAYVTCVAAINLSELVTGTAVTPIEVPHTQSISLSCVSYMCLYVFVCVQPAVLGMGGVGRCNIQSFYAQSNSIYFAHIFYRYRECEELIDFRRNL
jgi:hypothetical protein